MIYLIEKNISTILDVRNQEEFMELIITTFEKQLSKKPINQGDKYECLECGHEVNTSFKFCPNCGQKISWGD